MNSNIPITMGLVVTIFSIIQHFRRAYHKLLIPLANPGIAWEEANNKNIGIEGTLGGGKFTFELDYFNNLRSQMLIPVGLQVFLTLPDLFHQAKTFENFVIILDFLVVITATGYFKLQFGVNRGYSRNGVVFWDEPATVLPWQTQTGKPYNDPTGLRGNLMYNAIGVFRDQAAVDVYPHWPGARAGDIIFRT